MRSASRVAELADDVVGGAPGQEPAQAALARREVVGDPGRAERRPAASPRRRRPRSAGDAAERAQRGADPERPPVGAVGGLGLDPRLGAELGELRDQPLGRPPLAVGGRRALDPLQFLEPLAQPIRFVGIGLGTLAAYHGPMLGGGSITLFHFRGIRVTRRLVLVHRPLPGHPLHGRLLRRPARAKAGATPFLLALLSAVGFFGSILLHEFGHAIVAMRNGIGISSIQLWIFGGMARMDREADSPGTELKVALGRARGDRRDRDRPRRRPGSPPPAGPGSGRRSCWKAAPTSPARWRWSPGW